MSFIGSVVDPVLLMIPVLVLTILLGAATEVDGMAAAADLPLAVLPLPPLFFDGPPFPCPLPILNPPWLPFPAALEIRKQHERHKLGLGIYIYGFGKYVRRRVITLLSVVPDGGSNTVIYLGS